MVCYINGYMISVITLVNYKYEPTITVIKAITNAHFEPQFNSAYAPFGILGINNFSKSVSKGGDFLFI